MQAFHTESIDIKVNQSNTSCIFYLVIECRLASTACIVAEEIEESVLTPKFLRSDDTGIPSILLS